MKWDRRDFVRTAVLSTAGAAIRSTQTEAQSRAGKSNGLEPSDGGVVLTPLESITIGGMSITLSSPPKDFHHHEGVGLLLHKRMTAKRIPKSPEVTCQRLTEKQTRSGNFAARLVDQQKSRPSIVGEQRSEVNVHQLLISEHVFPVYSFCI